MSAILRLAACLVIMSAVEACASRGGDDAGGEGAVIMREFAAQERVDSTTLATTTDTVLRRRLSDLRRRALALPIDSTARLYAAIPQTADSSLSALRQALGCQTMILVTQGGSAAHRRATERMRDSLVRTGFAFERQEARMENAGGAPLAFTSGESCGLSRTIVPLPDSLDREVLPTRYMPR